METVAARRLRRKANWSAYLYLLPALALFGVFVLYPLVYSIVLSFFKWNGLAPNWEPVGVANYIRLAQDRVVGISLRNAGVFVVGQLVTMMLALAMAVFLSNPYPGRDIVRTIGFLPSVLASTIVGVTWSTIYDPNVGPLNVTLRKIGLGFLARAWLGDRSTAIWAVTVAGIWSALGFAMVVYAASLQTINPAINDSAKIDGANSRQIFWRITFPLLRGSHVTLLMLGIIGAVNSFALPFVMTEGGPYYATYSLTLHVFKSVFKWNTFGYGAALSVFILVLLAVLTWAQRALLVERRGSQ